MKTEAVEREWRRGCEKGMETGGGDMGWRWGTDRGWRQGVETVGRDRGWSQGVQTG